jgi:DNA excision repair protein ERCC-3
VSLADHDRTTYAMAEFEDRYRLAAHAPAKAKVVQKLLERHAGEQTLIIGQYLDQLEALSEQLGVPLVTGKTPVKERQRLFQEFREGTLTVLVVSKVANFSVDLPEATVAIQISGTFGSRQEEAQRLGRVLRPKADGRTAHFYTIVTRETVDAEFAAKRQRFLAEQGYAYSIVDADDLLYGQT